MTTEQQKAFEAFWSDPAISSLPKDVFCAGWEAHAAATADASKVFSAGRDCERERAAYKQKFLAKASEAFLAGDDAAAKGYRDIANYYFSETPANKLFGKT